MKSCILLLLFSLVFQSEFLLLVGSFSAYYYHYSSLRHPCTCTLSCCHNNRLVFQSRKPKRESYTLLEAAAANDKSVIPDNDNNNNNNQIIPPCQRRHVVHGIECVEVEMELPSIGRVVVLEATAESQEVLVNMALMGEDDYSEQQQQLLLNTGDPYGAVLWPAAYAIAATILTSSTYNNSLPTLSVLELGAGTGLVSLALSIVGAKEIIATDYETIPLQLLEYAASNLNNNSNSNNPSNKGGSGGCNSLKYQLLDMRDYDTPLPRADLIVAADIMYEPRTGQAMARRSFEALKRGSRVLVGDSPGRPGRTAFLQELERLRVVNALFVDTVGYTCTGPRHDLICGKDSSSASKEGSPPQELLVAVMELDPNLNLPKQ